MLFHWLPITPSSGSGSHEGQNTGASMRFARRCQPARAVAGQRTFADALTESVAPHPASARAAATRSPTRFTAPLKPVNRDPGPGAAVARFEVEDQPGTGPKCVVERRLARIVRASRKHAIGDGARDDHVADALTAKPCNVSLRVERPLRTRQSQMENVQPLERRRGRIRRNMRPRPYVVLDPTVREHARIRPG